MRIECDRLWTDLLFLAEYPRPAESPRLGECRQYVRRQLAACGWETRDESFEAATEDGHLVRGVNLIATHKDRPVSDGPRFCLGAHLDSRPETPGADDNASAVATMLEIARNLDRDWPEQSRLELELVAFDLEELGMLGGAARARRMREQGVDLRGMVSLEMLGYCDHRPDTQQLPRELRGMYPDTGNFIALIGNQVSTALLSRFREGMESISDLPVETLQVPENGNLLQATRLSDHSPFWDEGYAALMVTDTSFLRNPYYHTPQDTTDTLDRDFLCRVASGCLAAVRNLLTKGLLPA